MFDDFDDSAIYLDYAATTPVDREVRAAMEPFLAGAFGNPSSTHGFGQRVRRAIDSARDHLASLLSVDSGDIYFTSGGTEANNTAILGVLLAQKASDRDHVVTDAGEHHAVLDAVEFAKTLGFSATIVPIEPDGSVDPDRISDAITGRTALVSVMHASNELGNIHDVRTISELARSRGALFHTDAVQTLGSLEFTHDSLGADLLTVSAHKIYGPKGAGALVIAPGVSFVPWLYGGQQEREKRAGTENVPGIVGFGEAARLVPSWREDNAKNVARLRDRLETGLREIAPTLRVHGNPAQRLPHISNVAFPGIDGETLLLALDFAKVAASSGSACASGSLDASHVIRALGFDEPAAKEALRFSVGRFTTENEIDRTIAVLRGILRTHRRPAH